MSEQEQAIEDVLRERRHQQHKWGEQNHDMPIWLAILHEETGELSEAILHKKFGGPKRNDIFKESVQVAAVALQIVEFLRRQMNEARSKLADVEIDYNSSLQTVSEGQDAPSKV